MNIYIWEFKMSLKSLLYWTIALIAILIVFMSFFNSVSQNASVYENLLKNFPKQMRAALGFSTFKLNNLLDYYGYLFSYILLIGSIYAMKSGISILSEEIRSKTSDFLLAKPVKRTSIINAKLLCVLTNLLLQNLVYLLAAFLTLNYYKKDSFSIKSFILINLSLLLVQLFFVSFGLIVSVLMKKIKTVMPITLGIVFFFFVIQMLNETLKNKVLSYMTPFAYFNISKILRNFTYEWSYFFINFVIIVILIMMTYIIYNKKDMPSL
jgi:ABC-2 type transport system permease protein